MTTKQKIENMITKTLLCGLLIAGVQPAVYAGNSAEIMTGNNSTTLDLKVNAPLANKVNLFARNRVTLGSEKKVGYFGLADVSYNVAGGFDAVAEAQFVPGAKVIPRAGVEHFKKFGNVSLFNMGTIYLHNNPDLEFLTSATYNKKLNPTLGLTVGAENIVNFGQAGLNYGVQRIRAGLQAGKYELGGALDVNESSGTASSNAGAYVKVTF